MGIKQIGIDDKVPPERRRVSGLEDWRPRNFNGGHRRKLSFILLVPIVLLAPLLGGLAGHSQNDAELNPSHAIPNPVDELTGKVIGTGGTLKTVAFPVGSFVIPMDDKQNDVLRAFGFTHALLRNGTFIYRIIEPPDIIIETVLHPSLEVFSGGPILIMPSDAGTVNAVRLRFPSVSLDNTVTQLVSDQVDKIVEPTDILVIYGTWGHTQDVLTDMEIPFRMVYSWEVESNPSMLFDYDLIVDDCPGWYGMVPPDIVANMQTFAEHGGEIIFTDRALRDMDQVFPNYLTVVPNVGGTWPCSMYRIPEFPGQYYGPPTLDIYTMSAGQIMGNAIEDNVRILVDSNDYAGQYRILAAYFYYGAGGSWDGGIVEGFGYHPGDQPPDARVLASILYGNKFVHRPMQPDLEVTPPDIKFNPLSPVQIGTQVTVNATVHNIGSENASDVIVRFYDGAPFLGIQIGNDQMIPFIEREGGIGHAEVNWIAAGTGTHEIYVVADPEDAIAESNEDNNVASNFIEVLDFIPPMLYIKADGDDIVLNWTQDQTLGLSHYLLYRAPTQTGFDFSDVWMNTLTDVNPLTGIIDPLNPVWIDTNVTKNGDPNYRDEYYYIVRAVNAFGTRSRTSNTVGYYIVHFGAGTNTFSLPIQPLGDLPLNDIMTETGAVSISLLDDNDMWQTYFSDPSINARMGEGYVIEVNNATRYVFTGEPASMIHYNEGFGFGMTLQDEIKAVVDGFGMVNVSWTPIPGADMYQIYRSGSRNGFFTRNYIVFKTMWPYFRDFGPVTSQNELYYMVVPLNFTLGLGSSTYSIGVITKECNGNEMFGLPLKPVWGDMSADWYVDQIPNCLGIVFLVDGIWNAHFKEFPEGVYDIIVELGRGYELSVFATSLYSFVGW